MCQFNIIQFGVCIVQLSFSILLFFCIFLFLFRQLLLAFGKLRFSLGDIFPGIRYFFPCPGFLCIQLFFCFGQFCPSGFQLCPMGFELLACGCDLCFSFVQPVPGFRHLPLSGGLLLFKAVFFCIQQLLAAGDHSQPQGSLYTGFRQGIRTVRIIRILYLGAILCICRFRVRIIHWILKFEECFGKGSTFSSSALCNGIFVCTLCCQIGSSADQCIPFLSRPCFAKDAFKLFGTFLQRTAICIQLVLLFLESIFRSGKLIIRLLPFFCQTLFVLLQFFCFFVQLCLTGRQLFFAFGQFLSGIFQLCPGFCHLLVCVFLLMGERDLSIGQFLPGFVDILPCVGKFSACFRKFFICGIFSILNLFAGFLHDRIITCFFPLFFDPAFNIRYDGLHLIIIFIGIGVQFLRSVQGKIYGSEHIKVGILLCDKKGIITGGSGTKEGAHAIAALNIHGIQYHAGNGICRIGKGGRLCFLQFRFHIIQINVRIRIAALL